VDGAAQAVEALGYTVGRIEAPGTLDGGNVLKVGDTVYFTTIASSGTGGSSGGSSGSSGTSSSGSPGKTTSKDVVGSAVDKTAVFRGTLAGTVSAAGKLTLTKSGKGVTTLKSGRYTFTIQDSSSKADFTIQELRKNPLTLTGVAFVGKHTTTVGLKPGQWTFYSFSGKTNYFVVIS